MLEHFAMKLAPDHAVWLVVAMKFAIATAVFLPAISVIAMFSIWWERKVSGHIQSRVGPMHVGGWHGWAQSLADGIKLILKEDLVPRGADSFLFRIAPYLAFAPVFAAFIALPFGPQLTFEAGLNIGVLYLLAVLSVEVMSTILAGWASNSKWAVYGAMREACQMVSYEIPLGLSIITGVLVAGTLNLVELGYLQGAGMHDWFLFHNPFMLVAFLVYFIASLASNKRAPFDLPESESELVAGYLTEYSGLRWSLFFLGEYNAMFVVGGIQAALFLGGWNSPLGVLDPVYALVGYDPLAAGQAYATGALSAASTLADKAGAINAASAQLHGESGSLGAMGLILVNLYGVAWFAAKAMGTIFIQIWVRWTLPRIRIDQVLHTCVKVLLPISLAGLVLTMFWVAAESWGAKGPVAGTGAEAVTLPVHWRHLLGEAPAWQLAMQFALLGLVLLFKLSFVGFIINGWRKVLTNQGNPPRTLFPDVMPVGNQVAFTTLPKVAAAAEAPAPQA